MSNATHRVLRFEFSPAVIHAVTAFVGTHRYDDRKTYKEAWTAWLLTGDTAALLDVMLALIETTDADELLPQLRVGVAFGPG